MNPKILKNPDLRLTESRPCGIVLKDRKAVKVFIEDHFLTEKGGRRL